MAYAGAIASIATKTVDFYYNQIQKAQAQHDAMDKAALAQWHQHDVNMAKAEALADKQMQNILKGFRAAPPRVGTDLAENPSLPTIDGGQLRGIIESLVSSYSESADLRVVDLVCKPFVEGHLLACGDPSGNARAAVILGSLVLLLQSSTSSAKS